MKITFFARLFVGLLSLIASTSIAAESKFIVGPALGKDPEAFAKVFAIELKKPAISDSTVGDIWFAPVAQLGQLKVRRAAKQDFAMYVAIRFTDHKVTTWQKAFEKLGLATEGKLPEQTKDSVSITFPTENGKSCKANFYLKDPEGQTKDPMIEFVVK